VHYISKENNLSYIIYYYENRYSQSKKMNYPKNRWKVI